MNDRQPAAAVCDRDECAIDRLINKYSRLLWSVVCAAMAMKDLEERLLQKEGLLR